MKTTLAAIFCTTVMLCANTASATDPLPYPDVGSEGGDSKVKVKGELKGDAGSASADSSAAKTTTTPSQGKPMSKGGAPDVKVEGNDVIIR